MPAISNFISSADHFRITEYTLEYRICGKQRCIVCSKIGRGVRTPDISIKGKSIQDEKLWLVGSTVIDHLDKAHFLSINNTRAYIDTKIPSLEEIMSNLPAMKEDTIKRKRLTMVNYKYKGHIFDRYKVRIELFVMVKMPTDMYIPIKWFEQR